MKPLTEIKKGCGERVGKSKRAYIICGWKYWLNGQWAFSLCPTCQALLEQAQEFEKELGLIIAHLENCMEDDFEVHYENDCNSLLKELKELLKEVQGGREC